MNDQNEIISEKDKVINIVEHMDIENSQRPVVREIEVCNSNIDEYIVGCVMLLAILISLLLLMSIVDIPQFIANCIK